MPSMMIEKDGPKKILGQVFAGQTKIEAKFLRWEKESLRSAIPFGPS